MDTELNPLDLVASVDPVYETLLIDKGKRAQRRLDSALREPGRLREWLSANDLLWWIHVSWRSTILFKQQMRGNKHSCHSMHHGIHQWEKHHRNRRARYDMRDIITRIIKAQGE